MNASTTEYVYHNYQKAQYYRQYLKEERRRADGRKCESSRDIRISISDNNVVVSRGQTILIAQMKTSMQKVTYSPLSESFGKKLIDVAVKWNSSNKQQRNSEKSLEDYLQNYINWKKIEKQIYVQDLQKKQTFGHCGELIIRITNNDGCLYQTALLATFILLWTSKFKIKDSALFLKLDDFYFPFKYCDILKQIIVDPTLEEQNDSNYQVSIIDNIIKKQQVNIIRHLHKGRLQGQTIEALMKLQKAQVEKLPFNIKEIQERVKNQDSKNINLTISSL